MLGRGTTLGRPLALLLTQKRPTADAAVTVVHTGVPDWGTYTRRASVVVAAAGVPGILRPEHLSPGVVVVGGGVRYEGRRLLPDVDESCARGRGRDHAPRRRGRADDRGHAVPQRGRGRRAVAGRAARTCWPRPRGRPGRERRAGALASGSSGRRATRGRGATWSTTGPDGCAAARWGPCWRSRSTAGALLPGGGCAGRAGRGHPRRRRQRRPVLPLRRQRRLRRPALRPRPALHARRPTPRSCAAGCAASRHHAARDPGPVVVRPRPARPVRPLRRRRRAAGPLVAGAGRRAAPLGAHRPAGGGPRSPGARRPSSSSTAGRPAARGHDRRAVRLRHHGRRRDGRQRAGGRADLVPGRRRPGRQGHLHVPDQRARGHDGGGQRAAGRRPGDPPRPDDLAVAGVRPDGELPVDGEHR